MTKRMTKQEKADYKEFREARKFARSQSLKLAKSKEKLDIGFTKSRR